MAFTASDICKIILGKVFLILQKKEGFRFIHPCFSYYFATTRSLFRKR